MSDDARVKALADRLEKWARGTVVDIRDPSMPEHVAVREHQRGCVLTLSDGTIWRYYNASNMWEGLSGKWLNHFGARPIRADDVALTSDDVEGIRRVKHFAVTGVQL